MTDPQTADHPHMEPVKQTNAGDYFLTHCIWHNGYGPCHETGVRSVMNGEVQKDFRLIQHGVSDPDFAEPIILKSLRKGWDEIRIAEFLEKLRYRRRPRARFI